MRETILLDSLVGTWTLKKEVTADMGYYKVLAYLVFHFMPDPLAIYGCHLEDCKETNNHVCQQGACLNTETSTVEWSDVSAFVSFGFQVEDGVVWRDRIQQNTSDWVGPYNVILATQHFTKDTKAVSSRYVATVATDYLSAPVNISIIKPTEFDAYVGSTAVHATIQHQTQSSDDPYAPYAGTCKNGDIPPMLPRFQILNVTKGKQSKVMIQFDYHMWSFPDPKAKDSSLYKLWPAIQKHEPSFIKGPYCYGDDPKRGYAIHIDTFDVNNTWTVVQGCLPGLPCWPTGNKNNSTNPPHHDGSTDVNLNKALLTYGCYFLLLALVVSLTCNCQLSNKLKRLNQQHQQHELSSNPSEPRRSAGRATTEVSSLQEPLLPANVSEPEEEAPHQGQEEEISLAPASTENV